MRQGYHGGSSFPRTQPLAFGLLELFRGLRTASSQERLSSLASQIPSQRISTLCFLSLVPIHPLPRLSSSPFLLHVPSTFLSRDSFSDVVVDYRSSCSHDPNFSFVPSRSVVLAVPSTSRKKKKEWNGGKDSHP